MNITVNGVAVDLGEARCVVNPRQSVRLLKKGPKVTKPLPGYAVNDDLVVHQSYGNRMYDRSWSVSDSTCGLTIFDGFSSRQEAKKFAWDNRDRINKEFRGASDYAEACRLYADLCQKAEKADVEEGV